MVHVIKNDSSLTPLPTLEINSKPFDSTYLNWKILRRAAQCPLVIARGLSENRGLTPVICKEGAPGLPPLRGSLRCSAGQAAMELALRA